MAATARIVIVHSRAHAAAAAAAAAAAGVPVRLRSAPGAAAYAGAAWFVHVVDLARRDHPEARIEASLDCGDAPGFALAALRQGVKLIRFDGPARVAAKIAAIAGQHGAALDTEAGPALDLLDAPDPDAACRAWLGGRGDRAS